MKPSAGVVDEVRYGPDASEGRVCAAQPLCFVRCTGRWPAIRGALGLCLARQSVWSTKRVAEIVPRCPARPPRPAAVGREARPARRCKHLRPCSQASRVQSKFWSSFCEGKPGKLAPYSKCHTLQPKMVAYRALVSWCMAAVMMLGLASALDRAPSLSEEDLSTQ